MVSLAKSLPNSDENEKSDSHSSGLGSTKSRLSATFNSAVASDLFGAVASSNSHVERKRTNMLFQPPTHEEDEDCEKEFDDEVESASDWINVITSNAERLILTKNQVLAAIWSIGFEPTNQEWAAISSELELEFSVDSTAMHSTDYKNVIRTFKHYGVTLKNLQECLSHWLYHNTTPRPDNFRFQKRWAFFWSRLLTLLFPLRTPGWQKAKFYPVYVSNEQSTFESTRLLIYFGYLLFSLDLASVVIYLTGSCPHVDGKTIWSALALPIILGWGTQSAREACTQSAFGQQLKQKVFFARFRLYYTNFEDIEGMNGFRLFFEHLKVLDIYNDVTIKTFIQSSAHNTFFLMKKRRGGSRAEQEVDLEIETSVADIAQAAVAKQFNLFQLNVTHVAVQLLSLMTALLPTLVKYGKGKSNLFAPTNYTVGDFIVEGILIFVLFWTSQFTVQIILKSAHSDSTDFMHMSKIVWWCLDPEKSPGEAMNLISKRYGGDVNCLKFKLDSVEKVLAFENYYDFIKASCDWMNIFHISAFEVASIICVIATIAVLVSSIFGGDIEAWNSVLFLFGLFILIAMTRVFITVADCHKAVTKGISKGCNAQRHSNTKNLRLAVTEREKTQLRDANELLRTLSQRIDDKPPLLLFFVIPLTKENVVKLGGCVAASLFATVLRAFLSMENIISATTVVDEL